MIPVSQISQDGKEAGHDGTGVQMYLLKLIAWRAGVTTQSGLAAKQVHDLEI